LKALQAVLLALALLQPVDTLDVRIQRAVQDHRAPLMDRVMQTATDLGRRDVLAGALLGIAVLDPVQGPALARLAIAALVGTNLVVEGLKFTVNRPRPDGERKHSNASFPSGHAASAVCLAWILTRRWRRLGWFLWPLAGAVAWSRVYLNRHYLSDVVVGIAIGLLCTWAILRVRALDPARKDAVGARDGGRAPAGSS
jgi:undecaprenyl-diphosphatase